MMSGFNPTTYYQSSALYNNAGLYNGFRYPGENESEWVIELAVDLAANGVGDWFTLDDPVKGVLDNATYLLAGDVLIDITRWVRELSVTRGRSRQLQKFTAGTCRVTLDNRDRLFDPLMAGSPLFGSIVPRKEVRVTYRGQRVFTGNVEDWDFSYDISGDSIAIASAADALAFLSRRTYPAATETAQTGVDRFNAVLDVIGWPSDSRSVKGNLAASSPMGADVHDDIGALEYLQKVELSDLAYSYATRTGKLEYRTPAVKPYSPTYEATFGEGGIPFSGIAVAYEVEQMVNEITVTYVGGTATATSATSQTEYGMLASSYDTILENGTQATEFADAYLSSFEEPSYYISNLTVNGLGVSTSDLSALLSLELADPVRVLYRPNDTGEEQDYGLILQGISHDVTPGSHTITLQMAPPIVRLDLPDVGI